MEKQEIKKIKLKLPYVDENGLSSMKDMTIQFKNVIEKEKANYFNGNTPIYSMNMTLVIPDHIHKKLCGSTINLNGFGLNKIEKTYDSYFPKTISSESLEALTKRYRDIIYDYRWLLTRENLELIKVIYYDFSGKNSEIKSTFDSKKLGYNSEIKFRYMIGYISKDKNERLNENKIVVDQNYDKEYYKLDYVDYTAEREYFFKTIYNKYQEMIDKFKNFKESLNNESIDIIINSEIKLIG